MGADPRFCQSPVPATDLKVPLAVVHAAAPLPVLGRWHSLWSGSACPRTAGCPMHDVRDIHGMILRLITVARGKSAGGRHTRRRVPNPLENRYGW